MVNLFVRFGRVEPSWSESISFEKEKGQTNAVQCSADSTKFGRRLDERNQFEPNKGGGNKGTTTTTEETESSFSEDRQSTHSISPHLIPSILTVRILKPIPVLIPNFVLHSSVMHTLPPPPPSTKSHLPSRRGWSVPPPTTSLPSRDRGRDIGIRNLGNSCQSTQTPHRRQRTESEVEEKEGEPQKEKE